MASATHAKQTAERAARSPWTRGLARWGLVGKGALYVLVGVIALKVALVGGKVADRKGALAALADEPFGAVLLALVATGFAGYGVWRLVQAALGSKLERGEEEPWYKRLGYLGRAAVYIWLAGSTLRLVTGSRGGGSNEEDRGTRFVLELPLGRWIVGGVGLGFVAAACFNAYRGVTGKFREELKTRKMSDAEERLYVAIGVAGYLARAVVFGLVGVFLIRAAYQYDPKETVGLDGALSKVAQAAYGPVLLGIVAAGLLSYGLFCFVQARYREV